MIDTVKDSITQVRDLVTPKQYFSWQTILMLSLFSWVMAFIAEQTLATNLTVQLLSTGSWIFLTVAIWWALANNPVQIWNISLSAWITGAVICVFLFAPWTDQRLEWAIVLWPILSAAIAAFPNFMNWKLEWQLPMPHIRQTLVLMLLVNLLLSSWFLFYFRLQSWFTDYPSLRVESLDRSHFVYHFDTNQVRFSQGVPLLDSAADILAKELDGAPWPRAERWLLNIDGGIKSLANNVELIAPTESIFWSLDAPRPISESSGYALKLRANWLGPTAEQKGYYLEKTCTIMPRSQPQVTNPDQPSAIAQDLTPIARVNCAKGANRKSREPVT